MKKVDTLQDIPDWDALKEEAQGTRGIVIFKRSPICGVSRAAEREFDAWVEHLPEEADLRCAKMDVIAARSLSQHVAKEVGVQHQSPQVLWLTPEGTVQWHASHYSITEDRLRSAVGL